MVSLDDGCYAYVTSVRTGSDGALSHLMFCQSSSDFYLPLNNYSLCSAASLSTKENDTHKAATNRRVTASTED